MRAAYLCSGSRGPITVSLSFAIHGLQTSSFSILSRLYPRQLEQNYILKRGSLCTLRAFLVSQMVKNLLAMQETWVWSLGWEDPLEKGMASHSSILACRIPWTESLVSYSPWGCKESDTTEQLTHTHTSLRKPGSRRIFKTNLAPPLLSPATSSGLWVF